MLVLGAAAVDRLLSREVSGASPHCGRSMARRDGWRLNLARGRESFLFRCGETEHALAATAIGPLAGGWRLPAISRRAGRAGSDGMLAVILDGVRRTVRVLEYGDATAVFVDGESWVFETIDPLAPPAGADPAAGRLTAPMPGRVVQVLVRRGMRSDRASR